MMYALQQADELLLRATSRHKGRHARHLSNVRYNFWMNTVWNVCYSTSLAVLHAAVVAGHALHQGTVQAAVRPYHRPSCPLY
jgi:hypothetical protein